MARVTWLTDLHLNFVSPSRREQLMDDVRAERPDLVLIGGDIGEAATFAGYLENLAEAIECPIAFVLGNHDYYAGSIAAVRSEARELSRQNDRICWLPEAGVLSLIDDIAIVGHGGWGDARSGDFLASDVVLNDYLLIEELRPAQVDEAIDHGMFPDVSRILVPELQQRLEQLGDEAAAHLRRALHDALEHHRRVIVLMHVPPFREACWHQGRISDDNWAPHFVCQAAGDVLRNCMLDHTDREMLVLCGHTHSSGDAQILGNLQVLTGTAIYGEPAVQQTFDL